MCMFKKIKNFDHLIANSTITIFCPMLDEL